MTKHHHIDVAETVQDHRNLLDWSVTNETGGVQHHLPISMRFNDGHRLSIAVYSVLMVFSAVANITVLVLLAKRRKQSPSKINTMLMHLAIADLLVTFLMMPRNSVGIDCPMEGWRHHVPDHDVLQDFRTISL
ncbi:unnamed protein product [Acanthoscelides obtectus]|uniref:G-protein coupled receptors family 1 profile domain-containing protein n=1 Tax=Acanthoscelides obtectus TaxID=200917 RepID=A0A9P0Q3X9_ACAOB|nr:unnamed protein product [Acanthoscelides obtectus]CAK1638493.1 hypothetical protein AOBTE_LOCUS10634 [Acanthoscelides obtectus]